MVSETQKAKMLQSIEKKALEDIKAKGIPVTPEIEKTVHETSIKILDGVLKALKL